MGNDPIARASAPTRENDDDECRIKFLRACELTTSGVQFDVVWEGHELRPPWWQGVEEAVAAHTLFASPAHAVRRGGTLVPTVLWGVWVADGSRGVFRYSRQ